jgi:hypothetical protein
MLLELELPRVLAPDLSSNCYSVGGLERPHCDYPVRLGQGIAMSINVLGHLMVNHWERCAPAAFLRSSSYLSGYLSRTEP